MGRAWAYELLDALGDRGCLVFLEEVFAGEANDVGHPGLVPDDHVATVHAGSFRLGPGGASARATDDWY